MKNQTRENQIRVSYKQIVDADPMETEIRLERAYFLIFDEVMRQIKFKNINLKNYEKIKN